MRKLTIEQVRILKDLVEFELERNDPPQFEEDKEYVEELNALLADLSFLETESMEIE